MFNILLFMIMVMKNAVITVQNKRRYIKMSKEVWFEYTMGELFERPYSSNIIQLKSDIDKDKFIAELTMFMVPYMDFKEN